MYETHDGLANKFSFGNVCSVDLVVKKIMSELLLESFIVFFVKLLTFA